MKIVDTSNHKHMKVVSDIVAFGDSLWKHFYTSLEGTVVISGAVILVPLDNISFIQEVLVQIHDRCSQTIQMAEKFCRDCGTEESKTSIQELLDLFRITLEFEQIKGEPWELVLYKDLIPEASRSLYFKEEGHEII
tara:strand:+ start:1372 stop:1779 length:408 start_codon:yes stop_codon:yes gene_type:complete